MNIDTNWLLIDFINALPNFDFHYTKSISYFPNFTHWRNIAYSLQSEIQ